MIRFNSKYFNTLFSTIIALAVFKLRYGLEKLIPTNINWLLEAKHDTGQHYLGWLFFRNESWNFPLGKIESLHYPISTNIGFTDSIPLFAIPFKFFSSILPEDFQYFGIWLFLCFFFTSFFSIKILERYNFNKIQLILIAVLITSNPVLLYRNIHPALCAQWLIIASLYLYLQKSDKGNARNLNLYQLVLLLVSSLIHPYLTFMIAGFVIILPCKNFFIDKSIKIRQALYFPLIAFFSTVLTWFLVGYISFGASGNEVSNSYGLYGMNLNSLYNSFGYSKIIPPQKLYTSFQYEGYMYFGVGMIIFTALMIAYFIYRVISKKSFKKKYFLIPLLLYCFFMLLFSVTNKVTFNDQLLFEYNIPSIIRKLGNIFRASSRNIWVIYYLLFLFLFISFSKTKIHNRIKIFFLLLIVAIQLYDISPFFNRLNFEKGSYKSPLSEEKWDVLLSQVNHLNTFPLYNFKALGGLYEYQELAYLAGKNRTTYTNAYVARSDNSSMKKATDSTISRFISKPLLKDEIFVTSEQNLFNFSTQIKKYNAKLGYLDGYYIIYSDSLNPINQSFKENEMIQKVGDKISLRSFKLFTKESTFSDNIRYNIEELTLNAKFAKLKGWAFVDQRQDNSKDSTFLFLQNQKSTYIGYLNPLIRKDVTAHFKAKNLDNSGINSINYFNSLEGGIYNIGIAIKTENDKWYFQSLNKTLNINIENNFSLKSIQSDEIGTIEPKLKHNLESLNMTNDNIEARGWAMIEDMESDRSHIYIILNNQQLHYKIKTRKINRPDVTNHFKNGLNYNNSGFASKFGAEELPDGEYNFGIMIYNDSLQKAYFKLTDKKISKKYNQIKIFSKN